MKILVDKMPNEVSECDWANPTDPFWDENTIWFCDWITSHHETCPMVKGGECPFFTDYRQEFNDKVIEELNKIGEVYPDIAEAIKNTGIIKKGS